MGVYAKGVLDTLVRGFGSLTGRVNVNPLSLRALIISVEKRPRDPGLNPLEMRYARASCFSILFPFL